MIPFMCFSPNQILGKVLSFKGKKKAEQNSIYKKGGI